MMRLLVKSLVVGSLAVCVFAGAKLVAFAQDRPFVECYLADIRLKSANGITVSNAVSLVRRKFNPGKGTVEEEIVNMDAKDNLVVFKTNWQLTDGKLVVTEASGGWTGSYVFPVDNWSPEKFEGNLILKNQTRIRETAERTPFGLSVSRVYMSQQGELGASTTERHYLISEEAFEIMRKKLKPTAGSGG